MLHELHLQDEPFMNIQKGIKKVEARLFDEKRQKMKPGDIVLFINREHPQQTLYARIIELFPYPTFNEMFRNLHETYRSRCTWEMLENSMLQYYSSEDEKKYGIVGIRIETFLPRENTLVTYNNNIDAYISNTISEPSEILKNRIDKSLEWLSLDSSILEVGTWGGRDADYIESRWFHILRSDGAQSFVDYHKNMWKEILLYNVVSDELPGKYDLIFADAVLLHFPHDLTKRILEKRKNHLTPLGKISRCAQEGEWEALKENKNMQRYFYFRSEAEVREMMKNIWYKNIDAWVDEPEPGKKWIRCIATL